MTNTDFAIVIPVLDDWPAVRKLLGALVAELDRPGRSVLVLLVNDGGSDAPPIELEPLQGQWRVETLNLVCNLGHQRAIAVGLSCLADSETVGHVVVMDGDGEDRPADIPALVAAIRESGKPAAFASRRRRFESFRFRTLYGLYKLIFRLLTGRSISFGNFCAMTGGMLQRVVNVSAIWNHFAAGVMQSRLPFTTLPLDRGKRLAGRPQMGHSGLVLLGLSAVSVFADVVVLRMMLCSGLILAGSIVTALAATMIRSFTDLAIPGWATNVVMGTGLLAMQSATTFLLLLFFMLSSRTQRQVMPRIDYSQYIRSRTALV